MKLSYLIGEVQEVLIALWTPSWFPVFMGLSFANSESELTLSSISLIVLGVVGLILSTAFVLVIIGKWSLKKIHEPPKVLNKTGGW